MGKEAISYHTPSSKGKWGGREKSKTEQTVQEEVAFVRKHKLGSLTEGKDAVIRLLWAHTQKVQFTVTPSVWPRGHTSSRSRAVTGGAVKGCDSTAPTRLRVWRTGAQPSHLGTPSNEQRPHLNPCAFYFVPTDLMHFCGVTLLWPAHRNVNA